MYKVSVILPSYNREKTLLKTFESIRKQSIFNDIEVIFVDDGSVDKTYEIITDLANRYKNVIAVKNDAVE